MVNNTRYVTVEIEKRMRQALIFLMVVAVLGTARPSVAAVDHAPWDALLQKYVDDKGRVAYRDLQTHDHVTLARYLASLAEVQTEGMTENEEKALWINAYNAVIVNGVLDGRTAEGFLARKRFFGWYTVPVAGKDRSPDEIEHQILRKKFHDPRIHYALVCASTSCPQLRREAYVPERLDQQLDEAGRAFMNDPTRNRIDTQQVALSMIFKWFAQDFVNAAGSVPNFVERFVDANKKEILQEQGNTLAYLEYDWTLNAQRDQRISS